MPYQPLRSALLASALTMTLAASASAADLPMRKGAPVAPVPAASVCTESEGIPTDAFGFTTGSDVAEKGSFGPSLTYGGAFGTRNGKSNGHGLALQGSYGVVPCLEIGPYLLGSFTDAAIGGVGADSQGYGAGAEMKYRLLGRDVHGIGLTAVIDPSVSRTDPTPGGQFTAYNTGLRLFADKALVPGKLFAALNLSHDLTWTGSSAYARSSTLTIGGSLAWQLSETLYLSGEVRHQRRYATLGFSKESGYATYAGPGLYWQATKQLALSAAYNIQVAGKAKNQPGDLDLVNFSQHLVKVKAAYSF